MKHNTKKINPAFKQRQALPLLPDCPAPAPAGKAPVKVPGSKLPFPAGRSHFTWITTE